MWTQISERVIELIKENLMLRNEKGFETYKETMDDVPFENYNWNTMIIEELLDGIQYAVKENARLEQLNKDLIEANRKLLRAYGKNEDNYMDFNLYQNMSARTLPNDYYDRLQKSNFALGLNGESGELGDLVKKNVHHGHELDRHKFVGEVGDVLWYLSALCTAYDVTLEECATMNVHKLGKRYANGFSKEASINRVDVKA